MVAASLIAQVETDLQQVAESGISDVSGDEWLFAGVILFATIVISMIGRRLVERAIRGRGHPTLCHLGGRFGQALILVLGFFYAARSIDIAVGPLLGGLGIVGIALAFALQDFIANFAAGIMLQARRPIRIGDQIVTNELQGEVEDVNFRAVMLRNFDGETVYVPNMMVLTNPITNWTKTPTRRTLLEVGVAYDTDLELARRVLADAVASA
ncbi:MAG: mechanosensitive ion channel family protein, partial [Solirubrobacterales bacterium]